MKIDHQTGPQTSQNMYIGISYIGLHHVRALSARWMYRPRIKRVKCPKQFTRNISKIRMLLKNIFLLRNIYVSLLDTLLIFFDVCFGSTIVNQIYERLLYASLHCSWKNIIVSQRMKSGNTCNILKIYQKFVLKTILMCYLSIRFVMILILDTRFQFCAILIFSQWVGGVLCNFLV